MNAILSSLVFSVLASDRPGLVERISSTVAGFGGNWLESHLAVVGGYFGGIIHITVPTGQAEGLVAALQGLGAVGIDAVVRYSDVPAVVEDREILEISVVGNDRPGIVSRVSEALAAQGVNVLELETEYSSAPMTGNAIFKAHAILSLPPDLGAERLKTELERIANDLMVDLSGEW